MIQKCLLSVLIVITSVFQCIDSSVAQLPDWDGHEISTLRLLQIVHRHGERNALSDSMPRTDPFKDPTFWPEGYGALTNDGKYRMYKMGEYLRKSYQTYLGDGYSPREVYARSSVEHRCIESVSCLLSGLYPAENVWEWGDKVSGEPALAKIWQPFPIETFIPKDDDTLLVPHKKCPKATEEHQIISNSDPVIKIISNFHLKNISSYLETLFGEPIVSLYRGQQFYDTLNIEGERGHKWPDFDGTTSDEPYSQQQILDTLREFSVGSYVYDWNREFILRIRVGNLMETLITNMKNQIDGKNDKKLFVYSTHDTIVVPLLQALNLYNQMIPAYGAAVIFELHEQLNTKSDNRYSVKIYYYNNTLKAKPYPLTKQSLDFNTFESNNKKWFYRDFDGLCGIERSDTVLVSEMIFMVIGIAIGVTLLGLNILVIRFIRNRNDKNSFNVTKDH